MITQWIQFTVKAAAVAVFKAELVTLERESRREPGCAYYAAFQASDHPEIFTVLERWETPADFDAHRRSRHITAFKERCDGMITLKTALALNPVGVTSD